MGLGLTNQMGGNDVQGRIWAGVWREAEHTYGSVDRYTGAIQYLQGLNLQPVVCQVQNRSVQDHRADTNQVCSWTGNPPGQFTTNDVESANLKVKRQIDWAIKGWDWAAINPSAEACPGSLWRVDQGCAQGGQVQFAACHRHHGLKPYEWPAMDIDARWKQLHAEGWTQASPHDWIPVHPAGREWHHWIPP